MAVAELEQKKGEFDGRTMSLEELRTLPDDGRKYEWVDGEAQELPTWWEHGPIAIRFIKYFLLAGAEEIGALADSSTGFRMKSGNVRAPDVAFVVNERVPQGVDAKDFFNGAPDIAVEIISDSENPEEMTRKVVEYLVSGACQVWQVCPQTRRIVVYHSLDRFRTYEAHEELSGGDLLPGFQVPIATLLPLAK